MSHPTPLRFTVEFPTADTAVVQLSGEVDMADAAALSDVFASVARTTCTTVGLDAAAVGFADLAIVRLLDEWTAVLALQDVALTVIHPGPALARLYELLGRAPLQPRLPLESAQET